VKLIEGGKGDAWLEFYSGTMPKNPDDPVTTQRMLARLAIKPHTMRVEPGNAIRSGDAGWARLIGTDGRAVADMKVSTKDGDGFLSFNTVGFRKDGPITVFARMAIFSRHPREG
jgi:hypothetical protein